MEVEKHEKNGVAETQDKEKSRRRRSEDREGSTSKSHHKKKRSHSRDRSRSRKKKDKKSKKHRKRSQSGGRSRSRSPSRKSKKRRSRDRSQSKKKRDSKSKGRNRSRTRSPSDHRQKRGGGGGGRDNRGKNFRFDSPPKELVDLLNSALQKMNINTNPGKSIISAWISADGHYAFVEFRTPEEANAGFALNNVSIHGQPLKVGRPRSYNQNQQPTAANPLANMMSSGGGLDQSGEDLNYQANLTARVHPPSRILVLKNMVQPQELEIDEEFNEILTDVKEECGKYGKVLNIKAPRPKPGVPVPGLGKIYVEFNTIDEAKEARRALSNKLFGENKVECSFHSEEKFTQDDFTDFQ